MKLTSNLLNLDSFKKQSGSWDTQTRKRKGLHYGSDFYSGTQVGVGLNRYTDRVLSDSDLWTVYKRCADVRACVDSIVRRVATFDWMVVPKVSPQNSEYSELTKIAKKVNDFFLNPNRNGDTWQEIMTAMLTDCLVFDSGVLELAYDRRGNLQELIPLRGCTISPIIDEFGRLKFYEQNIFEEGTYFSGTSSKPEEEQKFKAKQIMYLSLFKNTALPAGNPLIESLVNQVIALMRATEHAMLNLDADEVPPGILVLAGIAGKAADEAKADLQRLKGQDHKVRVMTTPDPTGMGAKWLELRRTPKDIQMHEIIQDIRRVIYRIFGVMPVEMGMTQNMPKATATVQMDVASSHLVTPMLELIQAKINAQILPAIVRSREVASLIEFRFDRESRLSSQEQLHQSSTYRNYVTQGIMTRNEIREGLGLLPIIGGDVPTVEVAGMPQPLADIIHGHEESQIPKEEVKIEIDQVLEEIEEETPAPLFGNEPTKEIGFIDSRSTELTEEAIAVDETLNNLKISVSSHRFAFDDKVADKVILVKGLTYVLNQDDDSNSGYRMTFSADKNLSSEYTKGIIYQGKSGEDGSYIRIETDSNTPNILYFFCKEHTGMEGIIEFSGPLIETEESITNEQRSLGIYGSPEKEDLLKEDTPSKYNANYPTLEPPCDVDTARELEELKRLIPKRDLKLEFIQQADEDLVQCFVDELRKINLKNNGLSLGDLEKQMNQIVYEASIPIMKLKYFFNRPRPNQVADRTGNDFSALDSKTANTPSYPSGHTIQSFLIAHYLSELLPQYKFEFFAIADEISYSRIVAGYHFRSDTEYGKKIFNSIISFQNTGDSDD